MCLLIGYLYITLFTFVSVFLYELRSLRHYAISDLFVKVAESKCCKLAVSHSGIELYLIVFVLYISMITVRYCY